MALFWEHSPVHAAAPRRSPWPFFSRTGPGGWGPPGVRGSSLGGPDPLTTTTTTTTTRPPTRPGPRRWRPGPRPLSLSTRATPRNGRPRTGGNPTKVGVLVFVCIYDVVVLIGPALKKSCFRCSSWMSILGPTGNLFFFFFHSFIFLKQATGELL